MSAAKRSLSGVASRIRVSRLPAKTLAILVIAAIAVVMVMAFQKDKILTELSSGDTIQAEFEEHYKLLNYESQVKMGGVVVGRVTASEPRDDGGTVVSMKLEDGTKEKLGREPSAAIYPTTLVGGRYFVALQPGDGAGEFDDSQPIPVERTTLPVELDRVLTSVTPEAQKGLRSTIDRTDATLREGGKPAVKELLRDAPDTLGPTGRVLDAARGTQPSTDLSQLVGGLESTASVLTEHDGQLEDILGSLRNTTKTLSASREPVSEAVSTAPETLRTSRAGLGDLQGTLDRLTVTAQEFRPTAQELDPTLADLAPVVTKARPVVSDLRVLLDDAEPLTERLVPTAEDATGALRDIDGPVLDRLKGPIQHAVLTPWKGEGVYEGGGNDNRLYEQLGFLAVDGAAAFQAHDNNGSIGRLMAGVGGQTVGGGSVPKSVHQYLEMLGFGLEPGPGPNDGKGPGGGDPTDPNLNLPLPEGGTP